MKYWMHDGATLSVIDRQTKIDKYTFVTVTGLTDAGLLLAGEMCFIMSTTNITLAISRS